MIDFLARQVYYLEHLAPIWFGLPSEYRGTFYIHPACISEFKKLFGDVLYKEYQDDPAVAFKPGDCGNNTILTAAYGDAIRAADWNPTRKVILMEHGVGLTFGKAGYADGLGQREKISLFLLPNKHAFDKVHPDIKHKPHPVVGIPRLDKWAGEFEKKKSMPFYPTIAIAFHHGDKNSRPGVVGSAWEHYESILPALAERFKVIGHAHPMAWGQIRPLYEKAGIQIVESFNEVMKRADVYINDASSTVYEFLLTGKPVILLNAPWFDKKQNWGLRFWEYATTDPQIGPQVDNPGELIPVVQHVIDNPDEYRDGRRRASRDLFPYCGQATQRAVNEILALDNKQ